MNELNLVEENYNIWTKLPFDKKTISKVRDLKKNNIELKKYKEDHQELSGIFNKYTEAIKFNIATAEEIKFSLFEKDEKILDLEREINFYKFIASSKNVKDTISIKNFKTIFSKEDGFIGYSFLLLSNSNKSIIKGTFNFYYDGFILNSNKPVVRKNIKSKEKKLKFKNYIQVEGKITLPEDHSINVLYLDVKCNGKIYNYKHEFVQF